MIWIYVPQLAPTYTYWLHAKCKVTSDIQTFILQSCSTQNQGAKASGLSNIGCVTRLMCISWMRGSGSSVLTSVSYHWAGKRGKKKQFFAQTLDAARYESLPQAVPCVDLAIIQVVLLTSVEHKLSLMGAIFLWKTGRNTRFRQSCCDGQLLRIQRRGSETETVFMSVDNGPWELWKKYCFVFVISMPLSVFSPDSYTELTGLKNTKTFHTNCLDLKEDDTDILQCVLYI